MVEKSSAGAEAAVKSAARAIDVVEHVAASGAATAQQLSQALAIPASSLSYLLGTLVARGWLVADRRAYAIGPRLGLLLRPEPRTLADRAAPLVRGLAQALDETCGYFEARGFDLVALHSEMGNQSLNYVMTVGERGPLHAFAAGKALLAFASPEVQADYLRQPALRRYTPRTIVAPAALAAELADIRAQGFAIADGEHTPGVVSIAAPIGGGAGAISVAVPAVRCDDDARAHITEVLCRTIAPLRATD